eukprot:gb/GECH01002188.1/.p1 GENE.gb/GECH01002188.1/~~gb/GECH01002188.1/.p1  ORF type:complete len:800 (+),score=162.50 gb/GECH01002188.1/:1-2400(+)
MSNSTHNHDHNLSIATHGSNSRSSPSLSSLDKTNEWYYTDSNSNNNHKNNNTNHTNNDNYNNYNNHINYKRGKKKKHHKRKKNNSPSNDPSINNGVDNNLNNTDESLTPSKKPLSSSFFSSPPVCPPDDENEGLLTFQPVPVDNSNSNNFYSNNNGSVLRRVSSIYSNSGAVPTSSSPYSQNNSCFRFCCIMAAIIAVLSSLTALGLSIYNTVENSLSNNSIVYHYTVDEHSQTIRQGHVVSVYSRVARKGSWASGLGKYSVENHVRRGFGFNTSFPHSLNGPVLNTMNQVNIVSINGSLAPDLQFPSFISNEYLDENYFSQDDHFNIFDETQYSSISPFGAIGLVFNHEKPLQVDLTAQIGYVVTNSSGAFVEEDKFANNTSFSIPLNNITFKPRNLSIIDTLSLNGDETLTLFTTDDSGKCYMIVASFSQQKFGSPRLLFQQSKPVFRVSLEKLDSNIVAITHGDADNGYFCNTVVVKLNKTNLKMDTIATASEPLPRTKANDCYRSDMARITDSLFVRYSGATLLLFNLTHVETSYQLQFVTQQEIREFHKGNNVTQIKMQSLSGDRFLMLYSNSENFGTAVVGGVIPNMTEKTTISRKFDIGRPTLFDRSGYLELAQLEVINTLESVLITYLRGGNVYTVQGDVGGQMKTLKTSSGSQGQYFVNSFVSFGKTWMLRRDIGHLPSLGFLSQSEPSPFSNLPWNVYIYTDPHPKALVASLWGSTRPYGVAQKDAPSGKRSKLPVLFQGIFQMHSGLTPGTQYYCMNDGEITASTTHTVIGVAVSNSDMYISDAIMTL